ncbi:MAG: ABC transporter permease [Euryarchaeota archaeon]|nr:ABC transporter permease [Euryarchaeota archaeon]
MNLTRIYANIVVNIKGFYRNKGAMFFVLFFPILLILLFGAIFSNIGDQSYPIAVQNKDGGWWSQQVVEGLNKTGMITVTMVDPSADPYAYMNDTKSNAVLIIPENFTADINNTKLSFQYTLDALSKTTESLNYTVEALSRTTDSLNYTLMALNDTGNALNYTAMALSSTQGALNYSLMAMNSTQWALNYSGMALASAPPSSTTFIGLAMNASAESLGSTGMALNLTPAALNASLAALGGSQSSMNATLLALQYTQATLNATLGALNATQAALNFTIGALNFAIPSNETLKLTMLYDSSSSSALTKVQILQQVMDGFNKGLSNAQDVMAIDPQSVVAKQFKFIDYYAPGIVGMSVMTASLFGTVGMNTELRQKGVLRKLATTPLTRAEWLVSNILYQLILAFISTALILFVGYLAFGLKPIINIFLFVFVLMDVFAFSGIGMLITRFVKDAEAAQAAANLVMFPVMFLSGTFFQIEMMPDFLQTVANFMPLYYVSDGLRQAMILLNWAMLYYDLMVISVFGIIMFVLGILLTSWKED